MKYKCLIVDDELTARQGLQSICAEYSQLEVIGSCKNGVEAIDFIRSYNPDLVLLDVQMPKINGFEVLTSIPEPLPQVIFITAHDEFAIKAFEVNAIDYILKPFSDERFEKAIERAINQIKQQRSSGLSSFLAKQSYSTGSKDLRDSDEERLVIKADGNIYLISKQDILHVSAFDYYVKIHLKNQVYLIRESMKTMESKLDATDFLRVHKSNIVNKNFVESLIKLSTGEYQLTLITGEEIKVSRTKARTVKDWLA